MLNFVEKAQKEQLKKIKNAHVIVGKVLFWTKGDGTVANTIFRTILTSKTLILSNYLENFALWLASREQDQSLLLTGQQLELALATSHFNLTELENKFLVRSLVFNLRSS